MVRWLQQGQVSWRRTPLDLPILAFLGSAVISTAFAVNRNVAIFGVYDRWEGLLTLITYALLFWLAVQLMQGERTARGVTWSLLAIGYLIGAAAILQSGFGAFGAAFGSRASVTLAQPDFLGIFLAMLIPVALAKLLSRRPASTRAFAANLVVVLLLGMLASYTRAAWIGAVAGIITVLALRGGRFRLRALIISLAVIVLLGAGVAAVAIVHPATGQGGVADALLARVESIPHIRSGSEGFRLAVWGDTLHLVASRPIFGYGPDTFGLTYPDFQSANRAPELYDKPHQDLLGIAASQGLVGLAAYLWLLFSLVKSFWRGRQLRGAVALFGGFIAYIVSIQADFSWIPASLPFWLLVAAAIVTWAPDVRPMPVWQPARRIAIPAMVAISLALVVLLIPAIAFPYLADTNYFDSLNANNLADARAQIASARQFGAYEAVYAIEAGNYFLNAGQDGNPAPDADWASAQKAYETAARLGSYSPEMFRELAIVEEHQGDHVAAVAAARRALELDRFDKASRKLLDQLTGQSG